MMVGKHLSPPLGSSWPRDGNHRASPGSLLRKIQIRPFSESLQEGLFFFFIYTIVSCLCFLWKQIEMNQGVGGPIYGLNTAILGSGQRKTSGQAEPCLEKGIALAFSVFGNQVLSYQASCHTHRLLLQIAPHRHGLALIGGSLLSS